MSSTAIGAISKDTRTITFISKEHEEFYLKYLTKCRWKDVYHKALGCIGTVSVVGCSNKNFDSKVTGDNQTTTENVSDILNDQEKKEGGYENESSSNADDKENSADDSEVLANADLRGAVLEFSDTGCNISIGTQTDDAEMVPAPGAVVEEMNQVKIVYGENTYFQISHSTMTGITLEDCRKEEVKKQSMLYLYGDYQEDGTFLAKRVIIDRFE